MPKPAGPDMTSKPGSHPKGEINQISKPLPDPAKSGVKTVMGGKSQE